MKATGNRQLNMRYEIGKLFDGDCSLEYRKCYAECKMLGKMDVSKKVGSNIGADSR
jgi:hypothetical protein